MKNTQRADGMGWRSFVFVLLVSSNWNFRCLFRLTCRKCNAKIYFRFLLFALHENIESSSTKMRCSLATLPIFGWLCFDSTKHKWWSSRKKKQKMLPFHFILCSHIYLKFAYVSKCSICIVKNQNRTEKSCFVQQTKNV